MQKKTYDNVSIVISSCDKFKDAWEPFLDLLDKYWKNHPQNIYLNSERETYSGKYNNVFTITNNPDDSWTKRINNTIEKTQTEYILFFLEDYFIWSDVDDKMFITALDLMDNNSKIGAIVFHGVSKDSRFNTSFDSDDIFVEQSNKIISRAHVVTALYRKDYLLKMMAFDENPWKYERESYARSIALGKKILAQNYRISQPCFVYYLKPRDNIGINQGKWLMDTPQKFSENGINYIDYSRLGIYSEELKPNMVKDSSYAKQKGIKEYIYERIIKKIKYSIVVRRIMVLYYKIYFLFNKRGK